MKKMNEIEKFENLEPGKYYIAKDRSFKNKNFFICLIIKKDFVIPVYKYEIKIQKNTLGWESKKMMISFSDFRKYIWYKLGHGL